MLSPEEMVRLAIDPPLDLDRRLLCARERLPLINLPEPFLEHET